MSTTYDIIIIGSGAGGGTLARHLAPSGKSILLLERGGWMKREPENWSAEEVFVNNRYVSPDIWHDKHGKPFQPGVHYFVGGATKMYGEGNNGGEMVEFVIKKLDPSVNFELVWASKSKETRAEPVALLYSEGRFHHVGTLQLLEDEMCSWVPREGKSPNRIDALAWLAHGVGLTKTRTFTSGVSPLEGYRG